MTKYILIVVIIISALVCNFPSLCLAYFNLTHSEAKDSTLFSSNKLKPGDWEYSKFEDPITDEVIHLICKNSNDRLYGENHVGSGAMLCISYDPNEKKYRAYIRLLINVDASTILSTLRIGKEKPFNQTLNFYKTKAGDYRIQLPPQTMIDTFENHKRFVIRFDDGNSYHNEQTFIFDSEPDIFKTVFKPLNQQ